jgi:uncharacterized LabA/DUF88 family protein
MTDRAVVFIDGNNWYHSLRDAGVQDLGLLDYSKISRKLLSPRDWIETRYYIGRVKQSGNPLLYADQRRFLASLEATDSRIRTHLGRLEPRPADDPAARELTDYLSALKVRIDKSVFHDLHQIARRHRTATIMVEKAVDVMIAVDMVSMALRNAYDAAYLLSADGDFTPAVKEAKATSKKVYAASPAAGAELSACVDSFIRLDRWWFDDCYR